MNTWLRRLLLVVALVGVLVGLSGLLPLSGVYLGAFISICLGVVMVLAW